MFKNTDQVDEENSFLSNFLEFVNIDAIDIKKYKDSLITSYENTKFPQDAFAKESIFEKSTKFGSNGVSINDSFSYYKLVTSSIRQHLKDVDHNELAYLINEFVVIYELKSLKIMSKFKRNDMTIKEYETSKNDCIHGLQQFVRVMQETIVYYYNLNDSGSKIPQCCLFTKDNLLNFVISILLNDKIIYQCIFELESLLENKGEEIFKINCEMLQNLNPQDVAIPLPYCLNAKTIIFFNNYKTKNKENIQNKKKNSEDCQNKEEEIPNHILSKSNNESETFHKSYTVEEKRTHKDSNTEKCQDSKLEKKRSHNDSKIENTKDSENNSSQKNLPIKKQSTGYHRKSSIRNLKKFSEDECDKKDLNESVGKLEKTFYSASSSEIKNYPIRNNNFTLPERQNSESFLSIKMGNELSETNNNFISFDNSMENYYQNNNINDISQYHSISQMQESANNYNNNDQTKKILESQPNSDKNLAKKISFKIEEKEKTPPPKPIEVKVTFNPPYENSISLLKKIDSIRKPLEKLKKIVEVSDSIKRHIKEFYEDNRLIHSKNKQLDSDDLLAIFLYVLMKANIKSMRVHLKIIENFTTDNILNSKNGYYLMILQLCLRFVESLNPEELKKKNEESKKSLMTEKVKEWIREKRINKMMMMGANKIKR